MKDIIVKVPDIIPKEDTLEYIRGLLPTEQQREMFDFFIEHGLLSLGEE